MMNKTFKRLGAATLALCMMLTMMISASAVTKYYLQLEITDAIEHITVKDTSAAVSLTGDNLAETLVSVIAANIDGKQEENWKAQNGKDYGLYAFESVCMRTTIHYGLKAYEEGQWAQWVDKTYTGAVTDGNDLKSLIVDLDKKVGDLEQGEAYVMTYTPVLPSGYSADPAYGNTYTFTVKLISKNVTAGGAAPSTPATPSYRVTLAKVENAAVKLSETDAKVGDKITVTVTPDAGYKAESVVVKTGAGAEVAVTDNGDGTYSFTMPEGAVTIAVAVTEGTVDPAAGFQDLVADAWYMSAVRYCLTNDLMAGYNETTFGPNDNLIRAMVVQVLYNYEKNPEAFTTVNFDDVADGQWYTDAIRWASSKGVVAGYGDGVFGTEDNVTIEQVAVILWNYSGNPASEAADLSALGTSSSWAANALNWAVANGIFKDMPMENANATASRAQTAQMLMNYLSK